MQPPNGSDKKTLSQKELLSEALLAIRKEITKADRLDCAKSVNRSKRTINEYVNGHVYDLGIGFKVLTFFKELIEKRSKEIK